jgi:hypothetical protein
VWLDVGPKPPALPSARSVSVLFIYYPLVNLNGITGENKKAVPLRPEKLS